MTKELREQMVEKLKRLMEREHAVMMTVKEPRIKELHQENIEAIAFAVGQITEGAGIAI